MKANDTVRLRGTEAVGYIVAAGGNPGRVMVRWATSTSGQALEGGVLLMETASELEVVTQDER